MSARTAEVPDTARRHLLVLAHRVLRFPHMSVTDEVAYASSVADPVERDRAFTALCEAVRDGRGDAVDAALDALTGGARSVEQVIAEFRAAAASEREAGR